MLRSYLNSLIASILVALSKRVVDYFMKQSVPPYLRPVLPTIFEKVDRMMPELLQSDEPECVTLAILDAVEDVAKRSPTMDDLEAVTRLYSPVMAGLRAAGLFGK